MSNVFGFVARLVAGVASVLITFFVLDAIHDRNTEIIVACIGLGYCFTFVISRRWQYYGLNAVSLFGMTVSWVASEPHDHSTRQPLNLPIRRSFVVLSIFFAAVVELLCAFRILTSLLEHGWDRLAAPSHAVLHWPLAEAWLNML
jgi:NhaP-type Na+/H+ or K+/H+ antiporter